MKSFLIMGILFLAACAQAGEWRNVDAEHYLGGRKASSGYLQGKVVLACFWQASDEQAADELLPAVEEIWANFKTKPFVVLAAPLCEGTNDEEVVRRQLERHRVSCPVYQNAGGEGLRKVKAPSYVCVVDETGLTVYLGRKARDATQAVVLALTDIESPRNLEQWKRYLDYEIPNAPCHAFLRLKAFRTKFPREAQAYAAAARELASIPDLKTAAEFVASAKKAKDPPVFGPRAGAKKQKYQELVADMISNGEKLKDHPDARVVREVKNALADLKWTQAEF